ncbi:MAG: TIGR02757 family protein [Crocinitomicaceae bacterium]|nr:TIGR02757 family protein [Crocinitomicaceae bacterium]
MTPYELNEFLLLKAEQFESLSFIADDPISIPHQFKRKEDIEIIGLLVATIAWGNRKSIIKSGNQLVTIFGESPYDYVMNFEAHRTLKFVHRTFSGADLVFFIQALRRIYEADGLEASFKKTASEGIDVAISNFRGAMLQTPHQARSTKHLSNPMINSACKRLNMYLRWMVRSNAKGVDFGIWNTLTPKDLHIPLDVHTGNIARKLGILERTQNDWKSSQLLYEFAKELIPEDPSKLDFALFGLGAIEGF